MKSLILIVVLLQLGVLSVFGQSLENMQYLVMPPTALDVQERYANVILGYIVVVDGEDTYPYTTTTAFSRIKHPTQNLEALMVSEMSGMMGATVCKGKKCSVVECVEDIFQSQKPLITYETMLANGWFEVVE